MPSSCLIVSCFVLLLAANVYAVQPGEVNAFFRSGQTFITFKESGAARYKLYRSDKPIGDIADAKLLADVPKGSSTFHCEVTPVFENTNPESMRLMEKYTGKPGYGTRYIIQDNPDADPAKMLAEDVGLYVHTAHERGNFYYAVTAVDDSGSEETLLSPANSLAKPVAEKPEPTGAVLIFQKKEESYIGRVYTQWVDDADYNPQPVGGYAFNFGLAVNPKPNAPVIVRVHARACRYELCPPFSGLTTIFLDDPYQSWWYGYQDQEHKRVVNYTERRVVQTIDFVLRTLEADGFAPDRNRLYVQGNSMGGSGANFLGNFHGELFAAVFANTSVYNFALMTHAHDGDIETRVWGKKELNLPTISGEGVYDRMNLLRWHPANVGVETPFFVDTHGTKDTAVASDRVGDYYMALMKAKRPFVARWAAVGHGGPFDPAVTPNVKAISEGQVRLNETVPAIGFASSNDDPFAPAGQINCLVEWSCGSNDFDPKSKADDIVDEPARWEMNFRSLSGAEQTADITPRRCQRFHVRPHQACHWQNIRFADPAAPKLLAEGDVTADEYGLVTVEKFCFGPAGLGNRLVIEAR